MKNSKNETARAQTAVCQPGDMRQTPQDGGMTNLEKKKVLMRYQEISADIHEKCAELTEWRSKATRITPVFSDMPRSGSKENRLELAAEKIMEVEEAIEGQLSVLVQSRAEIEGVIGSVEECSLQRILRYRYIVGWTWEQIADELSYTYRNVQYLHGKALDRLVM